MITIELGDKVRDRVSGLEGIAVTKLEYMNGCIQYSVTAKIKKGETEITTWNIDQEQIEVMSQKKVKVKRKPSGGPTMRAKRM